MLKVSKLIDWDEKKRHSDTNRDKANETRRNVRVLKAAGMYKPDSSITPPTWFLNIYKSWNNYSSYNPHEAWSKWKRVQLDNSGLDREPKKSPGRPKMKDSEKKRPTVRTGRADKMEQLLLDNNIHLTEGRPSYEDVYLVEYPEVQFLPNGKLKDTSIIGSNSCSVHYFLNNLVT